MLSLFAHFLIPYCSFASFSVHSLATSRRPHLPGASHTSREYLFTISFPCPNANNTLSNTSVQTITFIQTPTQRTHRKEPDFVSIHLILLRIKQHTTDIVMTVNVPHYHGEYEPAVTQEEKTELMKEGDRVAQRILETFEVKDWGLFHG